MTLTDKFDFLKQRLSRFTSIAVAFSGGVDSTLLLKVACDILGAEQVLALTAKSAVHSNFESSQSEELAREIGVKQLLIDCHELQLPAFQENGPQRCYHCKQLLFKVFLERAEQEGFATVLDGSNLDDLTDYRPGQKALKDLQICSPLLEAALNKAEIRQLSKQLGLPTWDKQAFACLASRFPYGTRITAKRLQQVERCENWLREQGFSNYRVRYHGQLARIELVPEEFPRVLEQALRRQLIAECRAAGFTYVTLDLQGYRSGSMNELLNLAE